MALEDIALMRAVHGSTVLHPCDGNQTAKLVAAMAELDGISTSARCARTRPCSTGRTRSSRSAAAACRVRATTVTLVGCGITVHEALKAAERSARRGARDRLLLDQADRRRDARRGREETGTSSSSRTTGPRAGSARRCSQRWPSRA
jgi:transketolase